MAQSAPVTDFDPFAPEFIRDPYPTLARLQAETPVAFAPRINAYVVTKHADIEAILLDAKTFSSGRPVAFAPLCPEAVHVFKHEIGPNVTAFCDPPKHTEVRRHNMRVMSARRLKMVEPAVRAKASAMMDASPDGPFDLVSSLAFPLPALTIYSLLGFPESDRDMLKSWAMDRLAIMGGLPSRDEQIRISRQMADYWKYCEDFVARRASDRADDLTSDLLAASDAEPGTLSHRDITAVLFSVSVAGHETTTNLMLNLVRQLMTHRHQWDALIANPALIPNAVEEGLRYDNSGLTTFRVTTCATTIRGIEIPAGAVICCHLAAANRDGERFAAPEQFQIERKDLKYHVGFGRGIHLCLGNALTRMEVKVVLEMLTTRFPNMQLSPGQQLTFPVNLIFRGPASMLVDLKRAAGRGD